MLLCSANHARLSPCSASMLETVHTSLMNTCRLPASCEAWHTPAQLHSTPASLHNTTTPRQAWCSHATIGTSIRPQNRPRVATHRIGINKHPTIPYVLICIQTCVQTQHHLPFSPGPLPPLSSSPAFLICKCSPHSFVPRQPYQPCLLDQC